MNTALTPRAIEPTLNYDAVNLAREHLGITLPFYVTLDLPDDLRQLVAEKGMLPFGMTHPDDEADALMVYIAPELGAPARSMTLWHELTHVSQIEHKYGGDSFRMALDYTIEQRALGRSMSAIDAYLLSSLERDAQSSEPLGLSHPLYEGRENDRGMMPLMRQHERQGRAQAYRRAQSPPPLTREAPTADWPLPPVSDPLGDRLSPTISDHGEFVDRASRNVYGMPTAFGPRRPQDFITITGAI